MHGKVSKQHIKNLQVLLLISHDIKTPNIACRGTGQSRSRRIVERS
jgi:hypothetical protein